jgi:hypothetical protein
MVDADLYRMLVLAQMLVGAGFGLTYLWLYRPSRWRSSVARDSSGWVLVVTLFFLWVIWRSTFLSVRPVAASLPWAYVVPSLLLGALLVGAVANRLSRFLRMRAAERQRPTVVCSGCGGTGVVSAT